LVQILETAAKVSTMWSLAAFAIAAVIIIVTRKGGRLPAAALVALVAIVLLGLTPIVGNLYLRLHTDGGSVYRIRATVLGPGRMPVPVDDAKPWSSLGGEPKQVAGGWQFDIPTASRPRDGQVTIYAQRDSCRGNTSLHLKDDFNPACTIKLICDTGAEVRGIVEDDSGTAVEGVQVSVVGYGQEAVTTTSAGSFTLPAHAAQGESVRLHAQKLGYTSTNQDHPAGGLPATLIINHQNARQP